MFSALASTVESPPLRAPQDLERQTARAHRYAVCFFRFLENCR